MQEPLDIDNSDVPSLANYAASTIGIALLNRIAGVYSLGLSAIYTTYHSYKENLEKNQAIPYKLLIVAIVVRGNVLCHALTCASAALEIFHSGEITWNESLAYHVKVALGWSLVNAAAGVLGGAFALKREISSRTVAIK